MKYVQSQFDDELQRMLKQAKEDGKARLRVIAKGLHDRIVRTSYDSRMPMACNAMWKIWKEQGENNDRIIRTTSSRQSTTIEIELDT